tara:strand:+ start:308 stop:505 length:198 start_codon:yes stop_codon:yes gene_type:complete
MSSVRDALEKLDRAVNKLDYSVYQAQDQRNLEDAQKNENIIDVDFVAKRLDSAIERVEFLLKDEG